jgi:phosphoribosylglycinamide formyltransferase 1
MKNIVVFASGSGSNAENIIRTLNANGGAKVSWVAVNRPDAYVLKRAEALKVNTMVFDKNAFYHTDEVLNFLNDCQPDLIVLAGFLWLVPSKIVKLFQKRIINIHPALLPKYGGKGMFGEHVHQAVIANKETESGITIHYVNEQYDEGDVIFQAKCAIGPHDDAAALASKIHDLEYEHFPKVVLKLLQL